MKVKSMMVRVGSDTKEMERGLKTAKLKIKNFRADVKKIGVGMAAAAAVVVGAVSLMIKNYAKAGDAVHKMALRTGFSTESLSELKYAAEISGASLEALEKGVKKMSKTIMDAKDGLATYVRAFDRIGLKAEELIELSPEDQFDRIAKAIASVESPTIRAATAQEIFGRAGTQLLPLFAAGEEGLEKLRKKAHELGIVFDQEAANKAAALTDAMTTLKGAFQGVSFAIANEMAPMITVFAESVTENLTDVRDVARGWANNLLDFFMVVAKGLQGLQLAFHGLQAGVFKMGELAAQFFLKYTKNLWIGLALLRKMGAPVKGIMKDVALAMLSLHYASEGYAEDADIQAEKMATIIADYEKYRKLLQDVKDGIAGVHKETSTLSTVLGEDLLPASKDTSDILANLPGKLDMVAFSSSVVTGKIKEMTESQKEFAALAISEFKHMEASLKGFVGAIMGTFEQWALGQAIAMTMKLPFPANLLAMAVSMAAIKLAFAGIKSIVGYEKGGFVPKETLAHLHPGEVVLSAPTVKALSVPAGAGRIGAFTFSPTVNIYTKYLDDRTINQAAEKIFRRLEMERGRFG